MAEKMRKILNEVLKRVEPPKEDFYKINSFLSEFKKKIKNKIKKTGLNADVFEGGSFAKKTMIKKDIYDVDLFIRFDKKYAGNNISENAKKLLKDFKKVSVIHGSRDYFRIKESDDFFIELIPVIKTTDPKKAENITDLSYSHVRYINKKIKSKKTLDDIKIAKAFCHFTKTYGAESYIHGFSGYALELLIYYYGGFLKFIKEIANHETGKIIIDIEKHYKKKNDVFFDMNSSKLSSPIILVDPTFKQRNALAALSEETFEKFKKACRDFLKKPSMKFFENSGVDLKKIKNGALAKGNEFIFLEAVTFKQEGDIAGSKLLKFYHYLEKEISKLFDVKKGGFNYGGKKSARYFFTAKKKSDILFRGPFANDEKNIRLFKKYHENTFVKGGRIYAKEKADFDLKSFISNWEKKHENVLKEMSISDFRVIDS